MIDFEEYKRKERLKATKKLSLFFLTAAASIILYFLVCLIDSGYVYKNPRYINNNLIRRIVGE